MKKREFDLFDKAENIRIVKVLGYLSLAAVFIGGFFIEGHGHFEWENIPGFWPLFGFVACIGIVVVSKTIGKLWLQKKEGYYD